MSEEANLGDMQLIVQAIMSGFSETRRAIVDLAAFGEKTTRDSKVGLLKIEEEHEAKLQKLRDSIADREIKLSQSTTDYKVHMAEEYYRKQTALTYKYIEDEEEAAQTRKQITQQSETEVNNILREAAQVRHRLTQETLADSIAAQEVLVAHARAEVAEYEQAAHAIAQAYQQSNARIDEEELEAFEVRGRILAAAVERLEGSLNKDVALYHKRNQAIERAMEASSARQATLMQRLFNEEMGQFDRTIEHEIELIRQRGSADALEVERTITRADHKHMALRAIDERVDHEISNLENRQYERQIALNDRIQTEHARLQGNMLHATIVRISRESEALDHEIEQTFRLTAAQERALGEHRGENPSNSRLDAEMAEERLNDALAQNTVNTERRIEEARVESDARRQAITSRLYSETIRRSEQAAETIYAAETALTERLIRESHTRTQAAEDAITAQLAFFRDANGQMRRLNEEEAEEFDTLMYLRGRAHSVGQAELTRISEQAVQRRVAREEAGTNTIIGFEQQIARAQEASIANVEERERASLTRRFLDFRQQIDREIARVEALHGPIQAHNAEIAAQDAMFGQNDDFLYAAHNPEEERLAADIARLNTARLAATVKLEQDIQAIEAQVIAREVAAVEERAAKTAAIEAEAVEHRLRASMSAADYEILQINRVAAARKAAYLEMVQADHAARSSPFNPLPGSIPTNEHGPTSTDFPGTISAGEQARVFIQIEEEKAARIAAIHLREAQKQSALNKKALDEALAFAKHTIAAVNSVYLEQTARVNSEVASHNEVMKKIMAMDEQVAAYHEQLAKKTAQYVQQLDNEEVRLTKSNLEYTIHMLEQRAEAYKTELDAEVKNTTAAAVLKLEVEKQLALQIAEARVKDAKDPSGPKGPADPSLNTQRYAAQGAVMVLSQVFQQLTMDIGHTMKVASEFDEAMHNWNSIAQATAEQVGETSKQIIDISLSIPKAAADMAKGLYEVQSASIRGQLGLDVLKIASQAATAGMDTVATSTKLLVGEMDAFNLRTGPDAARIMNSLFVLVKDGQVHFSELAAHLSYVSTTAANMGVPLESLHAALATLTISGESFSQAVQNTNQLLIRLQHPTIQGMASAQAYGLTWFKAGEAMKHLHEVGIEKVLDEIGAAAGGSSVKLRNMFGGQQEAATAALILTRNNGERFKQFLADQISNTTAMVDAYNVQVQAFAAQTQLAVNALNAILIPAGTGMLKVLQPLVSVVTALANAFTSLPEFVQQSAGVLAMFTVGLVGVAFAIAATIAADIAMRAAFAMTLPYMVDMGIASAGTAFSIQALGAAMLDVAIEWAFAAASMASTLAGLALPVAAVVASTGIMYALWEADFVGMRSTTEWAVDGIRDALTNAGVAVGALSESVGESMDFTTGEIKDNLIEEASIYKKTWTYILLVVASTFALMEGAFTLFKNTVKTILVVLYDLLTLNFRNLGKDISSIWGLGWENIVSNMSSATDAIMKRLKSFAIGVKDVISGAFKYVANAAASDFTKGDTSAAFEAASKAGLDQYFAGTKGLTASWTYTPGKDPIGHVFKEIGSKVDEISANYGQRVSQLESALNAVSGGFALGGNDAADPHSGVQLQQNVKGVSGLPNLTYPQIPQSYMETRRELLQLSLAQGKADSSHAQRLKELEEFAKTHLLDPQSTNLLGSKITREKHGVIKEEAAKAKGELSAMKASEAAGRASNQKKIDDLKDYLQRHMDISQTDRDKRVAEINKLEDNIDKTNKKAHATELSDLLLHDASIRKSHADTIADLKKYKTDNPDLNKHELDKVNNDIRKQEDAEAKEGHRGAGAARAAARKAVAEHKKSIEELYKDHYEKIITAATKASHQLADIDNTAYDIKVRTLANELKELETLVKVAPTKELRRSTEEKIAAVINEQNIMANAAATATEKMESFLQDAADKRLGGRLDARILKVRQEFEKAAADLIKNTHSGPEQKAAVGRISEEFKATRDQMLVDREVELQDKLATATEDGLEHKLGKTREYWAKQMREDSGHDNLILLDKQILNATLEKEEDDYNTKLFNKAQKATVDVISLFERMGEKNANVWEKMKSAINVFGDFFNETFAKIAAQVTGGVMLAWEVGGAEAVVAVSGAMTEMATTSMVAVLNAAGAIVVGFISVGVAAVQAAWESAAAWYMALGPLGMVLVAITAITAAVSGLVAILGNMAHADFIAGLDASKTQNSVDLLTAQASGNPVAQAKAEMEKAHLDLLGGTDATDATVKKLSQDRINAQNLSGPRRADQSQASYDLQQSTSNRAVYEIDLQLKSYTDAKKLEVDRKYQQALSAQALAGLEIRAAEEIAAYRKHGMLKEALQSELQLASEKKATELKARMDKNELTSDQAAAQLTMFEDQMVYDNQVKLIQEETKQRALAYDQKIAEANDYGDFQTANNLTRLKEDEAYYATLQGYVHDNVMSEETAIDMLFAYKAASDLKSAGIDYDARKKAADDASGLVSQADSMAFSQKREDLERQHLLGKIDLPTYDTRVQDLEDDLAKKNALRLAQTIAFQATDLSQNQYTAAKKLEIETSLNANILALQKIRDDGEQKDLATYTKSINDKYSVIQTNYEDQKRLLEDQKRGELEAYTIKMGLLDAEAAAQQQVVNGLNEEIRTIKSKYDLLRSYINLDKPADVARWTSAKAATTLDRTNDMTFEQIETVRQAAENKYRLDQMSAEDFFAIEQKQAVKKAMLAEKEIVDTNISFREKTVAQKAEADAYVAWKKAQIDLLDAQQLKENAGNQVQADAAQRRLDSINAEKTAQSDAIGVINSKYNVLLNTLQVKIDSNKTAWDNAMLAIKNGTDTTLQTLLDKWTAISNTITSAMAAAAKLAATSVPAVSSGSSPVPWGNTVDNSQPGYGSSYSSPNVVLPAYPGATYGTGANGLDAPVTAPTPANGYNGAIDVRYDAATNHYYADGAEKGPVPADGPAYLHKDEIVVNPKQQKNLIGHMLNPAEGLASMLGAFRQVARASTAATSYASGGRMTQVNINNPTIRSTQDIKDLASQVGEVLARQF